MTTRKLPDRGLTYRTVDSPVGSLTLAGVGGTLMRLEFDGQRRREPESPVRRVDEGAFPEAAAQLAAYFEGSLSHFRVDLHVAGTDFQQRVWAAVRSIPYGQTRSYAQIAEQIGSPGASRAVGSAVGRNPVPIIVPCHRVIGSSGVLTGYVGGVDRKKTLLAGERGWASRDPGVSRRPSSPPESRRPAAPAPH
ncbi:MAG: methylated-DNA--[protein]-cysteine S-methyltransferase [Mycobacterium sp.]|nr:MAG: methylated-DNA--[protein]-cysteine S-methyltransferase [Mycobacterium sp.]